jgi:hypothetical protein
MAVMAREEWTDARIDDFRENVNQRFDQVDQRFDRLDADIRELRQSVDRMTVLMVTGFLGLAGLIVSAQIFF